MCRLVCVCYHEVCVEIRVVECQVAHIIGVREGDGEGGRAMFLGTE